MLSAVISHVCMQAKLLGGWTVFAMALGVVLWMLFLRRDMPCRVLRIIAALTGPLIPVCSCIAVPLALCLYSMGMKEEPAFLLLGTAMLFSPSGFVLAETLLGTKLAISYFISAGFFAILLSFVIGRNSKTRTAAVFTKNDFARGLLRVFESLTGAMLLGVLLECALSVLLPPTLIRELFLQPARVSVISAMLAGVSQYVCIPQDISLAAALVASGMSPGAGVAFLLAGAALNLPELAAIFAVCGKRIGILYVGIASVFSLLSGVAVNTFMADSFHPQFDLSGVATRLETANMLQLTLPAPLQTVCAALFFAGAATAIVKVVRTIKWI